MGKRGKAQCFDGRLIDRTTKLSIDPSGCRLIILAVDPSQAITDSLPHPLRNG